MIFMMTEDLSLTIICKGIYQTSLRKQIKSDVKKLVFTVSLVVLFGCCHQGVQERRIVLKTLNNQKYNVTLYKISTISDITSYVAVHEDNTETIVFHGNFGSVIDIYFRGTDTLYLKCYKPSSNITYIFKDKLNNLNVLKDTIITEEEYELLTKNK